VMVFADCTRALNIRWPDALQAGQPLVQMAGDKMASGTIMCRSAKKRPGRGRRQRRCMLMEIVSRASPIKKDEDGLDAALIG
jgi:hypothetical protein